jgi:DNA-binding IclR family transcriptional regulator
VVFATEENGRGVVLSTEVGEHGIFADIKVGQRVPLHGTAAGKAMLAKMPRHRVEEILDRHGMPALTENTITDRETLFTELDQIREQGYSINNAERIDGVRAVGVAVEDEDETVIGAFITSGPTRRISDERIEDELAETLLSAAEEFELRNRYSETS